MEIRPGTTRLGGQKGSARALRGGPGRHADFRDKRPRSAHRPSLNPKPFKPGPSSEALATGRPRAGPLSPTSRGLRAPPGSGRRSSGAREGRGGQGPSPSRGSPWKAPPAPRLRRGAALPLPRRHTAGRDGPGPRPGPRPHSHRLQQLGQPRLESVHVLYDHGGPAAPPGPAQLSSALHRRRHRRRPARSPQRSLAPAPSPRRGLVQELAASPQRNLLGRAGGRDRAAAHQSDGGARTLRANSSPGEPVPKVSGEPAG